MRIISALSRLLNHLPDWLLNAIQASISFTTTHLIHYRRRTIFQNLHFLFPNLSYQQKMMILQNFNRFIASVMLQTILNFSPRPQAKKKMTLVNPELLQPYVDKQQSVIIVLGHYSNWEFLTANCNLVSRKSVVLYKKLRNTKIDALLRSSRERMGCKLVSGSRIAKSLLAGKTDPTFFFFLSDQYPAKDQATEVVTFFNKKMRFLSGAEKFARKLNFPVMYLSVSPEENQHYQVKLHEISSDPTKTQQGEITQLIATQLERQITENPAYWLLSHKRFKDSINYL